MKKQFIYIIIFFNIILSAQERNMQSGNMPTGNITGKIIESSSNKPIEYGNIVLFTVKDSSMITGAVSNSDGNFNLEKVPFGRYYATISYIGYSKEIINDIMITPKALEVNLGTISLKVSAVVTEDVLISGEKDMIMNNLDKKIVNVDQNIASSGGTALDVMQNVPSVTVDADGTVSLRGSSNVTILVDGKPSGLSGISSSDVLGQIPASQIDHIEVVTNPSVRYDPEGTSGIINIILKKKRDNGFNGITSLNAGTGDKYNGSLNLNYKYEDFNFFGSYDNRFNIFNGEGNSTRISEISSNSALLNQVSTNNNKMKFHNFNAGADYFINDKNTLTLSMRHRNFDMTSSNSSSDNNFNSLNELNRSLLRLNTFSRDVKFFEYNANYKKSYDDKRRELTADLIYSTVKMNFGNDINQQTTLYNNNNTSSFPVNRNNFTKNGQDFFIAQANYIMPSGEKGRIETGFKSSFRNLFSESDNKILDQSNNQWTTELNKNYYINFDEQIHAAYAIFADNAFGLKYQLGLRSENVKTIIDLQSKNIKYNKDYFAFYPSVHLAKSFSETDEIQLSYSRRVDRPNNRQLNPFIDDTDSLNISYGNPLLDPQFTNSYELGYNTLFGKTSLMGTLFFRQTNDIISAINVINNNGITTTTFENIAKSKNFGIELLWNQPLAQWWRFNSSFSLFRSEIISDNPLNIFENKNTNWNIRFNSNMTLWTGIQFQLIGFYSAPSTFMSGGGGGGFGPSVSLAQGKTSEIYFVDLALRKDYMQGDLSVTLRITDIFNTRKFGMETFGNGFSSTSERRMDSRAVYLGLSFKINNYQNKQRKPQTDSGMEDF